MDTLEKQDLKIRTRQRNSMVWLTLDFGGSLAPLIDIQAELDALSRPRIENLMAITDESWEIKEYQRDRTVELSQAEVAQDAAIAKAKAATSRTKIAIDRAADEYTLAAKIYDAQVKAILMGAKEYAALVEQEALAADAARASVEVDKESVRQTKVSVQIAIENMQAAQVAADLARAQVDVAKAHVRAIMAEIAAGTAEVEVIETRVQVAMTEAEKATLQADVAMVFAEAITKQLSAVKLGVGAAEISAGYGYVASKLSDANALYAAKAMVESIRAEGEMAVLGQLGAYQSAKETGEDLRAAQAGVAVTLASAEAGASAGEISAERGLKAAVVAAKNSLDDARKSSSMARDVAETAGRDIVNAAQAAAYRSLTIEEMKTTHETEYISG